ncbi:MAG: TetR/AcrR family transcriptional regulator [Acidobacteriota bacterium]
MEDAVRKVRRPMNRDVRGAILDAAAGEFAARGFEGARVDSIAHAAGVNKAMLYYYHRNKEGLYEDVLLRNFGRVQEALDAALQRPGTPEDRLRSAVAALLRVLREVPEHPAIMLREVASGAPHLPPPVLEQMAGLFLRMRGLLREGQDRGDFRPVHPLVAHLQIVGAIIFLQASGTLRERFSEVLGQPGLLDVGIEDLSRELSDLILFGVGMHGAPSKPSAWEKRP